MKFASTKEIATINKIITEINLETGYDIHRFDSIVIDRTPFLLSYRHPVLGLISEEVYTSYFSDNDEFGLKRSLTASAQKLDERIKSLDKQQ